MKILVLTSSGWGFPIDLTYSRDALPSCPTGMRCPIIEERGLMGQSASRKLEGQEKQSDQLPSTGQVVVRAEKKL